MTREEAYEILKTGICLICAHGCKNMDDCDISYCGFRDAVKTVMEESCEDAISREDALMCMTGEFLPFVLYKPEDIISKRVQRIKTLPSVQPKIKNGKWIYRNYNWYCSECENTPKTLGYVGTAEFMKEHFKFCNHCGAMMLDTVMTEDEEEVDNESGN